jgi:di/tricarboxylate transporter
MVKLTEDIETVVMIIGLVGASVFLVVQLFCLSDFAANWAISWEQARERNGNHWNVLIWIGLVILNTSHFSVTGAYDLFEILGHSL